MVLDINHIDKDKLEKIGKKVQTLRKEKAKLSYKNFAEAINMNKNTYFRIEKGEGDYNIIHLIRIISYYDLSLSEFFRDL